MNGHQLKLNESATDLEQRRDQLVEMVSDLERVLKDTARLCEQVGVSFYSLEKAISWYSSAPQVNDSFLREADAHFWKSVVDTSGICKILPCANTSKLQKEIAADPPPFKAITANEMMKKLKSSSGASAMMAVRKIFNQLVTSNFRKGNNWHSAKEQRSKNCVKKGFVLVTSARSRDRVASTQKSLISSTTLKGFATSSMDLPRPNTPTGLATVRWTAKLRQHQTRLRLPIYVI